jgi:hypothetical protein
MPPTRPTAFLPSRSEHLVFFFSSRLGCLSSLIISVVVTLILLFLFRVL